MKLSTLSLIIAAIFTTTPALSKSLKGIQPDWISENILAWATPIQLHCGDEFFLRHSIFDLVWDIYELKTGGAIEKNPHANDMLNRAIEKNDREFGSTWDCRSAYKSFGESGDVLRGIMFPRRLDRELSNPFDQN